MANIVTLKTTEAKLPKGVLREWWKQSEKYEKYLDVDSDIVSIERDYFILEWRERSKARKSLRIEADRNPSFKRKEHVYNIESNYPPGYDPCWLNGC